MKRRACSDDIIIQNQYQEVRRYKDTLNSRASALLRAGLWGDLALG